TLHVLRDQAAAAIEGRVSEKGVGRRAGRSQPPATPRTKRGHPGQTVSDVILIGTRCCWQSSQLRGRRVRGRSAGAGKRNAGNLVMSRGMVKQVFAGRAAGFPLTNPSSIDENI